MKTSAMRIVLAAQLALAAATWALPGSAHAVEGWGHIGLGASTLDLAATPSLAHSGGRGATVDLGGGVTLARHWQLGIDAGTLVQETTFCGGQCSTAQQQRNRSLDHYLVTARYVPGHAADGLFLYASAGLVQYRDAHASGPGGPAQDLAQQRQGSGSMAQFGVGYRLAGRAHDKGKGLVVTLDQDIGHVTPDNRAFASYRVSSTTLSLAFELW